jgi:C60 family sortase B
VLFISMIVFGGLFLRDFLEYRAAEDEYASLQDHIVISEEPKKEAPKKEKAGEEEFDDEPEEEPVDLLHPHFQIDYGALSGVNADFTAVLHVPALSITYPVVKSKDNEEYLHRTFEGKANFAGSIFLDANAKGSYDHKNTFIFGHNMKNGTMFGKLKYFLRDDQLANSNPYVFLCRPEGITRYRIFSYYLTTVESPIYNDFEGDKGYDQYLSLIQRLSSYRNYPKDSIDFSQRPDIITLSTCSGPSGGNQRFIVQAALEEVYQNG